MVGSLGALKVAQGCVAVSAHDKIQTSRLLGKLLILLVPDMREGGDTGDVRRAANEVDGVLHGLDRRRELRALARARDTCCGLRRDANDGELVLLVDMVRLNRLIEHRVVRDDIGGDDREGEVLEERPEGVVAPVELVVSERHAVEAHLVHGLRDLLSAVVGEEERALEFVARRQEKTVLVPRPRLVHDMLDASVAAEAALLRLRAVCARRSEFVEVRMDVVHVVECWRTASVSLVRVRPRHGRSDVQML